MNSPATLGTPCLVPVQVDAGGTTVRGFITRLARGSAAVSTDPELPKGQRVSLRFRRPTDNEPVVMSGAVAGLLPGGGLWRGRSAALVELDHALEDEFFGGPDAAPASPRRRGSEGHPTGSARSDSFGAAFTAGLGRRRRPVTQPTSLAPAAVDSTPTPPAIRAPSSSETGRRIAALSDAWAPVTLDGAESIAPPVARDPLETAPPGALSDFSTPPGGLLESGALPPVHGTEPELAATTLDPFTALVGIDGPQDDGDDDFFGQFGRVQDLPDYNLPPGSDTSMPGTLRSLSQLKDTDLPGSEGAQPADSPPGLTADGYFDLGGSDVAQDDPQPPAHSTFGDLLNTGAEAAPVLAPQPGPPPPVLAPQPGPPPPSRDDAPWEVEDRGVMSLIPRNARITSAIPVTYWARGRSNHATAQNFSKEGLFLATDATPPVRGAIVRVEFPIEGEGAPVPVRFNAEVRWHGSDRPQSGLPEGFGVQILTFESPKDRVRYDELLLIILTLNAEQDREDAKAFKWGRSDDR